MRQKSYMRASSRSSSYYGEKERRGRKAINLVFAAVALAAIFVMVFLFLRYQNISLEREEAAGRLSAAKEETERLNEERRTMRAELESLSTDLDKLRIEYDSLSE